MISQILSSDVMAIVAVLAIVAVGYFGPKLVKGGASSNQSPATPGTPSLFSALGDSVLGRAIPFLLSGRLAAVAAGIVALLKRKDIAEAIKGLNAHKCDCPTRQEVEAMIAKGSPIPVAPKAPEVTPDEK